LRRRTEEKVKSLAVVVLPEAAQPLLAAYPAAAVAGGSVGAGKQKYVPFARMIPLGVKMFYVFSTLRSAASPKSANLERHSSFTERTQRSANAFRFGLRGGSFRALLGRPPACLGKTH
jgi:hypothetical protein